MTLTAFYALDQEHLPERHWCLADSFAEMHDLATSGTDGLSRITVPDLMLALEGWNHVDDGPQFRPHRMAVSRIIGALGATAQAAH